MEATNPDFLSRISASPKVSVLLGIDSYLCIRYSKG